jgi:hypothetical protein
VTASRRERVMGVSAEGEEIIFKNRGGNGISIHSSLIV